MDEPWIAPLEAGDAEAAWDRFIGRHRRLVFSAIRRYASEPDDVMDIFARVCEALREDDFRRLRAYIRMPTHEARFGTWLVTVVHHLAIDWIRQREGRGGHSSIAQHLPPLRRRIFELVFERHYSHVEAYESLHAGDWSALSFHEFLGELRATYRTVAQRYGGGMLRELAPPAPEPPGAEAGELDLTIALELENALRTLDPDERLLLKLYVVEEVSAASVAKIVGLPNAKAVYNRVYRTLAVLRARLEDAGVPRADH